uniref:Putative F-box protein At1g47790 n=1 Tax=Anthurium amnicola TaxID=1678845 RepID=A0A1D1YL88_9ARAE
MKSSPLSHYGLVPCPRPRPLEFVLLDRDGLPVAVGLPTKRSRWGPCRAAPPRPLPEELLYLILSRLPVKDLLRYRSVCRSWLALISDPSFVAAHMERSKQDARILLRPLSGSKHRRLPPQRKVGLFACDAGADDKGRVQDARLLFETEEDYRGLRLTMSTHHCDGLILFAGASRNFVCNPSLGEFVALPDGTRNVLPDHFDGSTAALGFDPFTREYKVARCFYRSYSFQDRECSLGCEILTLGGGPGSFSWRTTAVDPPYPVLQSAQLVEGTVYWRVYNDLHSSSPQAILSLQLRHGEFATVPPPPCFADDPLLIQGADLRVVGSRLCLPYLQFREDLLDIWVLEDPANHVWTKDYSIRLPRLNLEFNFIDLYRGKILLMSQDEVLAHDPEGNAHNSVIDSYDKPIFHHPFWGRFLRFGADCCLQVNVYAESLVSVRGQTGRLHVGESVML